LSSLIPLGDAELSHSTALVKEHGYSEVVLVPLPSDPEVVRIVKERQKAALEWAASRLTLLRKPAGRTTVKFTPILACFHIRRKKKGLSTRISKRSWLTLVLVFIYPATALAQAPIDPLRRPEEPVGQYTWRLGLGYTPSGQEGMGIDELGRPYTFTRFSQEWRLTLSGTVQLATGLKTGFEVSEQTLLIQEVRRYPDEEVRLTSSHRAMLYTSSVSIGWIRKILGIRGLPFPWATLGGEELVSR